MSATLDSLQSLASAATLKAVELNYLMELVNEMELEKEVSDDCPAYITAGSIGALKSATKLMAELLDGLNADLDVGLRHLVDVPPAPIKRGAK
ncbi:MAG: hypothetical protein L0J77_13025 [Marinobacter sp.]|nr:hypothetical protein [Marinobacter sp.]